MSVSRRLGLNTPDSQSRTVNNRARLAIFGNKEDGIHSPGGTTGGGGSPSPNQSPRSHHLLNSPKPSPGIRVQVQSPAPATGQQPPASYATLPALDRSHRYVITGTLQQSLFGVVKLAFDRKLKIQVAIKISRRERAAIQQTRSGVSVLENVRREAALMHYLAERSASGNSLIALNASLSNGLQSFGSHKKKSSRMLQHEKELAKVCPDKGSLLPHPAKTNEDSAMGGSPHSEDSVLNDQELDSETNAMKMMSIDNHANGHAFDAMDLEGERYICRFIEELEDEFFHYLINEFVPAGDLYSMLTSFPQHRLSEPQARGLFRQIVLGMRYLHNRNLAHLDMSLENICLDADENIRIIDFGVGSIHPHTSTSFQTATHYFQYTSSTQLGTPNQMHNQYLLKEMNENNDAFNSSDPRAPRKYFPCQPVIQLCNKPGKIRYMSPELFSGQAWDAFLNDVFSLGVILYSLLTGRPPFQQADNSDVWFNVIYSGQWLTHAIRKQPSAHVYTHLSPEALDLINSIIKPESQRLTLHGILNHPWLNIKDD